MLGLLAMPLLLGVLAACSGGGRPQVASPPSASRSGRPSPTPGGNLAAEASPPTAPMDDLEQAVAARLGRQVAHQGLDLSYVACPRWRGKAPRRMTCQGFIDGVRDPIHVRLHRLTGGAVSFRARLAAGLIATSKLEEQLRSDGFHDVNCGKHPAYPSVVGSHVVCQVTRSGHRRFVVATITSRSGSVQITGY